jgi:transcription elongation factor Elf1
MAFRCAACGQDFVLEATLAPESTLQCFACEKILGRTDEVVTQLVDVSSNISTEMLKLALQKLFSAA